MSRFWRALLPCQLLRYVWWRRLSTRPVYYHGLVVLSRSETTTRTKGGSPTCFWTDKRYTRASLAFGESVSTRNALNVASMVRFTGPSMSLCPLVNWKVRLTPNLALLGGIQPVYCAVNSSETAHERACMARFVSGITQWPDLILLFTCSHFGSSGNVTSICMSGSHQG